MRNYGRQRLNAGIPGVSTEHDMERLKHPVRVVVKTGIKAARGEDAYRVNITCARTVQRMDDTTRERIATHQRLCPYSVIGVLLEIPIALVHDKSIQPAVRSELSASR